jgi:hypothetical protein
MTSTDLLREIFSIVPIPDDAPPSRRRRFRDLVRRWRAAKPDVRGALSPDLKRRIFGAKPRRHGVVSAALRPFIEAMADLLIADMTGPAS